MAKQLARQGTCTVLKRKMLFVFTPPSNDGAHEASASSPVFLKCDSSTTELLAPLQRFTPSANRLRNRLPVITRPLVMFDAPAPTHQPTLVCSTHTCSIRDPLPAPPLNPFSGLLSSRSVVSPRMAKSKKRQLLPTQ